jgi:hypothetical protein
MIKEWLAAVGFVSISLFAASWFFEQRNRKLKNYQPSDGDIYWKTRSERDAKLAKKALRQAELEDDDYKYMATISNYKKQQLAMWDEYVAYKVEQAKKEIESKQNLRETQ